MAKFTQLFTDSFKKIKEKVTNSSSKKDTKYGSIEKHESTHEVRAETREKMVQTTQEIRSQIRDSSSRAKIESSKKLSKSPAKKLTSTKTKTSNSSKTTTPKKSTLKVSTQKSTPQIAAKSSTKPSAKKSPSKSLSKSSKKETSKVAAPKATKKNASTKSSSNTSQSVYTSFPSGKIVNSVVLSEVERGYLELAGFKNYKDAFLGLDTASKRSKIAKQIATQTTTVSGILKKLELLQIKGVGENLAFVLTRLEVTSLQKLVKANSTKLIAKIQNYSKTHPDVDIKLSEKQLQKLQKEAAKTSTAF